MGRNSRIAVGVALVSLLTVAMVPGAARADDVRDGKQLRVDCRYYGEKQKFCYASAIYRVVGNRLADIRYGVGCDRETIYNDSGTYIPQELLADAIRPKTAATPRIDLKPGEALRSPGTYMSTLEVDSGRIENGICYVSEYRDPDYLRIWEY